MLYWLDSFPSITKETLNDTPPQPPTDYDELEYILGVTFVRTFWFSKLEIYGIFVMKILDDLWHVTRGIHTNSGELKSCATGQDQSL